MPEPRGARIAEKPTAELTAAVLVEAIPYIRRFSGKVVVVKYGGNALQAAGAQEASALSGFAEDIVLLHALGVRPVVVHGGGPQIGALMARLGKTPEFRDGLRVTDAETLEIARMVLVGKVNRDIVTALNVHGPIAVGLSGEDAGLIRAAEHDPALGFVGDVVSVDARMLTSLLGEQLVPVLATIGADVHGQSYNINADTVAGAVATALRAEKLVFLTDVDGIRAVPEDPSSRLSRLQADEVDELIGRGVIGGGMIPKANACAESVRSGVGAAHILDGRVPHALLVELFTEEGVGTMVVAQ
jgi:acetylglutamate kinase